MVKVFYVVGTQRSASWSSSERLLDDGDGFEGSRCEMTAVRR